MKCRWSRMARMARNELKHKINRLVFFSFFFKLLLTIFSLQKSLDIFFLELQRQFRVGVIIGGNHDTKVFQTYCHSDPLKLLKGEKSG